MRVALTVFLCLCAVHVSAAWRVGLSALSQHGDRAVIIYASDWVEVDLMTGDTFHLQPPIGCAWTSAAYSRDDELALTAHCGQERACQEGRASLWLKTERHGLAVLAEADGERWNYAVWWDDRVVVRRTKVLAPLALGLNDLGARQNCALGEGVMAVISPRSARVADFDIAPEGWAVARVLAAAGGELIADLRAGAPSPDDASEAAAAVAAICDDPAGDWRAPVCGEGGFELSFAWRDGDWALLDTEEAGWGRLLVSGDMSARARETCIGEHVAGRLQTRCDAAISSATGARAIRAPEGLFGDVALSGDGRIFASLAAGRGLRIRRFDLFNVETGEVTDLSAYLELGPPWGALR